MERLLLNTYCFDIDGTICSISVEDYNLAIPYEDRIKQINKLYLEGNKIIFYTARGYLSGVDHTNLTTNQLKKWGVNYHEIIFGKPAADYYIDDKAKDIFNWFKV